MRLTSINYWNTISSLVSTLSSSSRVNSSAFWQLSPLQSPQAVTHFSPCLRQEQLLLPYGFRQRVCIYILQTSVNSLVLHPSLSGLVLVRYQQVSNPIASDPGHCLWALTKVWLASEPQTMKICCSFCRWKLLWINWFFACRHHLHVFGIP